jgi:hypothetical protein
MVCTCQEPAAAGGSSAHAAPTFAVPPAVPASSTVVADTSQPAEEPAILALPIAQLSPEQPCWPPTNRHRGQADLKSMACACQEPVSPSQHEDRQNAASVGTAPVDRACQRTANCSRPHKHRGHCKPSSSIEMDDAVASAAGSSAHAAPTFAVPPAVPASSTVAADTLQPAEEPAVLAVPIAIVPIAQLSRQDANAEEQSGLPVAV